MLNSQDLRPGQEWVTNKGISWYHIMKIDKVTHDSVFLNFSNHTHTGTRRWYLSDTVEWLEKYDYSLSKLQQFTSLYKKLNS